MSLTLEVVMDSTQIEKVLDLVLADRAYYDADNVDTYDEMAALRLEKELFDMINKLIGRVDQRTVSKYGITVLKEEVPSRNHVRIEVLYNPNSWDAQYDSYYYDIQRKQVIFN